MNVLVQPNRPSKIAPCVRCGEDCKVHIYAATKWVKCYACKKAGDGRRTLENPFAPDLNPEDRKRRFEGRTLTLKRALDGVEWEEAFKVKCLNAYGERSVSVFAIDGGQRTFEHGEVVSVR